MGGVLSFRSTRDDFEFVRLIGEGAFGKVSLVKRRRDGVACARKTQHIPSVDDRTFILKEVRLLRSLRHANIVKYETCTEDVERDEIHIYMEFLGGGNLTECVQSWVGRGGVPTHEVLRITCRLLQALAYMHSKRVLHRDIKPANIVFNDSAVPKLVDFGLSRDGYASVGASTFAGSPAFMAPEMTRRARYDDKVDIWSLGTTLYYMASQGKLLYATETEINAFANGGAASWAGHMANLLRNVQPAVTDLVRQMLAFDPELRPSAADLLGRAEFLPHVAPSPT